MIQNDSKYLRQFNSFESLCNLGYKEGLYIKYQHGISSNNPRLAMT